jgi:hypothetical protein
VVFHYPSLHEDGNQQSTLLDPHVPKSPLSFSQVTLTRHQLFANQARPATTATRNKAFQAAILSDHGLEDTKTLQQTKPLLDKPRSTNMAKMARIVRKLRAVLSLMCLDLPSTDNDGETDNDEIQVLRSVRAETHFYPKNTLMGLPTELRLIIYRFALQDVVDTIVSEVVFERRTTIPRFMTCLGGLALPLINRTIRKESLDAYGPLVKQHLRTLWQHYIRLQKESARLPALEQNRAVLAEVDAYLRWRAVGRLQRVINCMYINECYVRGYYGELYAEARASEWRERV